MDRNPFTPSFGSSPPLLVGRGGLLEDFAEAVENGPGSPGRASIYTGARGVGKTVTLNAIEDVASGRGWAVIAETATAGFIRRLVEGHLPELLSVHDPDATRRRLGGMTAPAGLGGAAWTTTDAHPVTLGLRNQIAALTDLLAEKRVGLLVTLDEIHRQQTDELREFGTVLQHAFREGRDLAFAGAGLPSAVSDLLNDEVLTFLRRADRHMLGPVPLREVARAIHEPIATNDRTIGLEALEAAARATGGYPFLIQLVGHHIWRKQPDNPEITSRDVGLGVIESSAADGCPRSRAVVG